MSDEAGNVTRYDMITWRGRSCFWWYRDEIRCSGPDEAQQSKLVQMAQALNAFAVGDDGDFTAQTARHSSRRLHSVSAWQRGLRACFRSVRLPLSTRRCLLVRATRCVIPGVTTTQ